MRADPMQADFSVVKLQLYSLFMQKETVPHSEHNNVDNKYAACDQ